MATNSRLMRGVGYAGAAAEEGVIAAGYHGRRSPLGRAGEPVMVVMMVMVVVVVTNAIGPTA